AAYTGTFTLAALGAHTIQFYSIDVLGNTEFARSAQVAVAAPPAAVVDLALAAVDLSSVTLRWTEPVSTVPQVSYDLRHATFPITTENFASAIAITAPAPVSSGTVLTIDVAGVTEPEFYAAVVSRDALGGVSPLSNVAGLTRSTVIVNGYPELAFSANQPVTATLLSPAEGKGAVAFASAAPAGLILVSSIYDLGPEGAVFDPHATLTLRYSTTALSNLSLVPSELLVYQYVAGTGWVPLSVQTLSADAQSVTADVPSLASIFALLGKSHVPPSLALTPINGSTVTTPTPRITAIYSAIGPGIDPATVRLTLDGADATASAVVTASSASFVPAAALTQGTHTVTASVADYAGNVSSAT
ncbi:MAG: Ig-like domain-containing protein, partial [Elusimicrobiota bacterium]